MCAIVGQRQTVLSEQADRPASSTYPAWLPRKLSIWDQGLGRACRYPVVVVDGQQHHVPPPAVIVYVRLLAIYTPPPLPSPLPARCCSLPAARCP